MTETPEEYIVRKLKLAGILISAGLTAQGLSLVWNHPLSFVAFLGVGGALLMAGIVVYLIALVSNPAR